MNMMSLKGPLEVAGEQVRKMLCSEADALESEGIAVPEIEGKLLRPLVALTLVPESRRASLPSEFWSGALAIQMVHEASLLHDDILDGAAERRGQPTCASDKGPDAALVTGDLYLTGAYRAASRAQSPGFLDGFIRAVERTVAGEVRQNLARGTHLSEDEYEAILTGKSGELFGVAALLAAELGGSPVSVELGCRIGSLYQRVDDLLDYCTRLPQGKPALQDWRQRKWTFVLGVAGITDWSLDEADLMSRLRRRDSGPAPLEAALKEIREAADLLQQEVRTVGGEAALLGDLMDTWCDAASRGVELELQDDRTAGSATRESVEATVVHAARSLGSEKEWGRYFGRHSRSFRFASWLFPAAARRDIAGIYSWCRFTDDIVDESDAPVAETLERVSVWRELSESAWEGHTVDVPLLDTVMPRMARSGAPFHYVDSLLEGVAMDLSPVRFETIEELEGYSYRVASAVGGWITEQFGTHDPAILSRAYSLGHAMQMTNILRDVGEDWNRDRLYLPRAVMSEHGIDAGFIDQMVRGVEAPDEAWAELVESLMRRADDHYARAFEALPCLPTWYARPVAVACRVYQGIHDQIRRNGYDNLRKRAYTSLPAKLRLGAVGLRRLRAEGRTSPLRPSAQAVLSTDG